MRRKGTHTKSLYRRWWAILIYIIILLLAFTLPYTIPLISKTAYKDGEILGFYGNIIGAITTLVVFFFMIRFTLGNQKDERKKSIKPLLQTEFYFVERGQIINMESDNHSFFLQYLDDNQLIEGSHGCPTQVLVDTVANLSSSFTPGYKGLREFLVLRCVISNVGCGSAVSINIIINGHPAFSGFSLPVGENKTQYYVFGKNILENNQTENALIKKTRKIDFEYNYEDVSSLGRYKQCENITVYSNSNDEMGYYQIGSSFLSEQLEI